MSQDHIKSLYRECSELRESALALSSVLNSMQDISVNASIVASQTGSRMRVFTEIASQLDKSSSKMRGELERILDSVSQILKSCLRALMVSQRVDQYSRVLPHVHGHGNRALITQAIYRAESGRKKIINLIGRHARVLERQSRQFESHQNLLFLTLTSIRVENELFGNEAGLRDLEALALSLEDFVHQISEDFEKIREKIRKFRQKTSRLVGIGVLIEKRNIA